MLKLGFDSYLGQGPGIFLCRLQRELESRGQFSAEEPDAWIQLPFQELPETIEKRAAEGLTRVIVRMNGCYCRRYHVIRKPVVIPVPFLDTMRSKKINGRKNAQILKNLGAADGVIYQSQFSRQLTHRFVTSNVPGTIVYNGVPLDMFSPEGPQMPQFEGRLNILTSHSFRPYHRLHDSMSILAALKSDLVSTQPHLHVLGGDDDSGSFAYARERAQALGLTEGDDFTFWGKLPFDELSVLYRSCDFMLNLSYWDSCPNVVIEALACGLPVVGVNHGGVAELVDDAGTLVNESIPFTYLDHMSFERMPKAPVSRYLNGIAHLISEHTTFKAKALERARAHFDIRKICDEYLAVAQHLCQSEEAAVATS